VRSSARGELRPPAGEREEVAIRPRMQLPEEREDLVPDQAALRVGVRRVRPERETALAAVANGVLAPELEQRAHDAVAPRDLDRLRAGRRHEPIENGLDLVRSRVPGRPQAATRRQPVARVPQRRLGRSRDGRPAVDHLGPERLATEACVSLRLVGAEPMIDVRGGDAVAELAEDVPQAGGIGAAGDEARDLAPGRKQVVPADRLRDPIGKCTLHAPIVRDATATRVIRSRAPGSAALDSTLPEALPLARPLRGRDETASRARPEP
jgi:hypothetical protein